MKKGKIFPMATDRFGKDVWGITTGEFRSPKKGEFYVSGAIPEVYDAPNDLGQKFNICKLVKVNKRIILDVKEIIK